MNIPKFFESHEKQMTLYNSVDTIVSAHEKYNLTLHISENDHIDLVLLRKLISNVFRYESLTFVFYDIPENYYDIFDLWRSSINSGKDIKVIFYGQMFPDNFSFDGFIMHLAKMIKLTVGTNDPLNSLDIQFEESSNIAFVLYDDTQEILGSIPTKKLSVEQVIFNSAPMGPGDDFRGKPRVEKFFHDSLIPDISIDRIGEKKNNTITLHGF